MKISRLGSVFQTYELEYMVENMWYEDSVIATLKNINERKKFHKYKTHQSWSTT